MLVLLLSFALLTPTVAKDKKKKKSSLIRVLLIDGQSINHKHWKEWTPILLRQLDDSGLFRVDISTSPMKGESLDKFNPKFKDYDVIVSTYDGDIWSTRMQKNLEKYVAAGGGFVVIHAADNAFPDWEAYNAMIGIGGWGDRTEAAGPYVYIDEKGEIIRDLSPGAGGHHGPKHEYAVEIRTAEHPIMKDIPKKWLHTEDELYHMLRGPATNMEILATAYSSEKFSGSRRNEPVLMTVKFGQGRVFHSVMGHQQIALSCVGFMTTFVRGCEWAAKRKVSFEIPSDFPKEDASSSRTY